MKFKFIILFVFINFANTYGQQLGISVSYATSNTVAFDFFYGQNDNRFHLGWANQSNGQKNTVVKERGTNYGLTKIEDGDFFWLLDLGYSRVIKEKFTIHSELSLGQKHEFTNYEDNRFTDDGYSLINSSETKAGIGLNGGFLIGENFEIFAGYHTMKKVNFGIRFMMDISIGY